MLVLSPELSRYHANDAEIVTRPQTKSWSFTQKCTKTTGHDRFQYTIMLLTIRSAQFVHHMWVLSPELSRYHANDAEIVTRPQTKSWYFTERCTKTTGHDRFQYTIMLLMILAAQFVHHMLVLSPELSRYHANDAEIVTRSQTKTWSFTQKCTNTTGDDSFQYTMMQLLSLIHI